MISTMEPKVALRTAPKAKLLCAEILRGEKGENSK